MTNTIAAICPDRGEYLATVEKSQVAKTIKILQNKGYLNVKVIK